MRPDRLLLGLLTVFAVLTETCIAAVDIGPRAAPLVQTSLRCTTQYCATKLKAVKTSVYKTVKVTVKNTITKNTYLNTRTVKDPKKTTTKTTTIQPTITYTISTITRWVIVWSPTATRTRWYTNTVTTSVTLTGSTTVFRTPATRTVPAPSGHVPVLNDPANAALATLKKRDASPEPVPANSYPKVVACVKSLKTVVKVTSIKTTAKKTITVAGKTSWKKIAGTLTTVTEITLKNAPTKTIYDYHTTSPRGTRTITTTISIYAATSTSYYPTPTFYAACGPRNQAPPPGKFMNVDTGYGIYAQSNLPAIRFNTNDTAYDCCVKCLTLPASQGVCQASFWTYINWWGAPPCAFSDDPDCEDPIIPDEGQCALILEGATKKCQTGAFYIANVFDPPPVAVMNGPRCAHWKRDNWGP